MTTATALRLSVGANVVLLAIVAVLARRDAPSTPPVADVVPSAISVPAAATSQAAAADPAASVAAPAGATGVTPAALDQLERMGISREVLVNAVLGEFHRRWDQRFAELEKRHAPRPVPEREYIELGRQRDAEQAQALREALGETRYLAWDKEQTLRMHNPGGIALNADEAEKIYRLQKEYNERHRELQMAMEDGFADVVDVGTLNQQAQAELDRQLQQLLGRERFDRMRGINDPVTEVYHAFGALQPTPDQAQAVVRAQESHRAREAELAAELRANPAAADQLAAELEALNLAREQELRDIFGAEAYDATRRQNDPTYQRLNQFAEAWELSSSEIDTVYASLRAFQDQADRERNAATMREAAGQPVDWQEVNATIEQARQQTELGLLNAIGGNRLWRMKQDGLLTMR